MSMLTTMLPISGGGGSITSIVGTANKVDVSTSLGVVTITIPDDLSIVGGTVSGTLATTGTGAFQGVFNPEDGGGV